MGYIITCFIIIVNLLGTTVKKNSKIIICLSIIAMWVLFGWNNNNPDYVNYFRSYNVIYFSDGLTLTGRDIGFKLLMNISSLIGLDYKGFLIITSIVGILLIHSTVKKYSTNSSFVYLLYFIYPFFLDVVQVRNFLMMAIIIYSIRFLLQDSKYSNLKYFLFNIVAVLMHSAAILYLPLLFIKKNNKNNLLKGVVLFSFLFSIIIFLNGNEIPFIKDIMRLFIDNQYIISWFDKKTEYGFLLFWGMHFLSFFMIRASRNLVLTNSDILDPIHIKFVNITYWVFVIGFIWFPFYMVSIEFTRLMRNLFLLNYISFTITNKALSQSRIESKVIYNTFVFAYTLCFFIIQIYSPHFEDVFVKILENNYLWQ